MTAVKYLVVLALLAAGFWVWRHAQVSDTRVCVPAPAEVCVDRATTTTRPRPLR